MQQELTWVLEKIMFSFVVGGSPLAVEDLYCIIQNYNVLLWCLEPYVNSVSPAVLCELSLEENHAQCKVTEEVPTTPVLLWHFTNTEANSFINRSFSKVTHQRSIFPQALAVPYKFYLREANF